MRSNILKFLAITLAALFLFAAAACVIGMVYIAEFELYTEDEAAGKGFLEQITRRIARDYAEIELAKLYGGMEDEETHLLSTQRVPEIVMNHVIEIDMNASESTRADVRSYKCYFNDLTYPVVLEEGEDRPVDQFYVHEETHRVWINGRYRNYTLLYYAPPYPMYVTVHVQVSNNPWLALSQLSYTLREYLLPLMLLSLALFVACMVYLCWAAGKKKGREEIVPGGLNRIPLDLYALASVLACFLLLVAIFNGIYEIYEYHAMYTLSLIMAVVLVLALCLVPVCFIFAFAAQVKAKGYWWRNSIIGWCCIRAFRVLRWCWRGLKAVFRMLSVIWQWLLTAAVVGLAPVIALGFVAISYGRRLTFWTLIFFATLVLAVVVVLHGGWCFGTILKAAKGMAAGDLDRKIDTRYLYGSFRDCAENLNTVSQAAMVAARKQMQSERMKTELITNVSHDIKTPLTSIINYVDLLQKPHSDEENTEYLEVLARQSQRLKKLTEDLVEMSKASTGNVAVELQEVDAGEAVLQALGEFGDKLDAVPLSVVFPQPQEPVMICADGRLSWRVMSNLLGNAVKYAMPGTRLYVNVERAGACVVISFKNISRESLNISAEELMERFVRGDASRNTEGSGLGLNIAQSLMEVQGGTLELTVDGDLFKVTLTFPAV